MRTLDDLVLRIVLAALAGLVVAQALAGCDSPQPSALGLRLPSLDVHVAMPDVEVAEPIVEVTEPAHDLRAGWCEPLDPPFCRQQADCDAREQCVRPWWAETDESKVCNRRWPTLAEKRWRSDRMRVFVDRVCRRGNGCEPNDLHAYLRLLTGRESSWRLWKRHRLGPDRDAAAEAWAERKSEFADNPAADNPDRWSTGLGPLAQNPALWLPRWDPMAPPEVLCGEVEPFEAHLRAARDQVRKIRRGVDCDDDGEREFFGTACDADGCSPSWYDASRTNSGSPCPGDADHQRRFVARAADVGLDPWGAVTTADLGASIPRAEQDEVATELRERMDALD